MQARNLTDHLNHCHKTKSCVLATNFYNYETLSGILQAASQAQQPIILQLTEGSIRYMGLQIAVSMAKTGLKAYGLTGWLHLDHGRNATLIRQCLDAGFDSVMIDASEQSLEKNICITREIVRLAESYGVNVEAELGYVQKPGSAYDDLAFTDPGEARRFVEETGVNSLAVAVGSAHGFYKKPPELDLERLAMISSLTKIPLVLHGGSGIADQVLSHAIHNGICKINLATEIKNTFMQRIKYDTGNNTDIDLRNIFPPAIDAVKNLIFNKLKVICQREMAL